MTKYVIVPHGKREIANVTLKTGDNAKILYDGQSNGYGSRNEDPYVRYENAWFYSFCHSNETLNKSIRKYINSINKNKENISFVFMSPKDKKNNIWIIDTVIQLSKLINIPKKTFNKSKNGGRQLSKLKMENVVKVITNNTTPSISQKDVERKIVKYHLPEFYKNYQSQIPKKKKRKSLLADNTNYNKNAYWSEVHNKKSSSTMILGLADMENSYFPLRRSKDKEYECVEFQYPELTDKIERYANKKSSKNDKKHRWVRYHAIKMIDTGENQELNEALTNCLDKAIKIKAKDIRSDAQGMIIPNKK